MVAIRPVKTSDAASWLSLRCALWPDGSESEHRHDIEQFIAGQAREPQAVLLALDTSENVVGFAELSIRPYAEGCHTNRVAYLEGWYILPRARGQGIGRALVEAAAAWGRTQGCAEFASDAEPNNEISTLAHRALGFEDVDAGGKVGRSGRLPVVISMKLAEFSVTSRTRSEMVAAIISLSLDCKPKDSKAT